MGYTTIFIMKHSELKAFLHFAEINGMLQWPLDVVLNEYYTTKQHCKEYEN